MLRMTQLIAPPLSSHRTLYRMAIARVFAMVFATSASAAPLSPTSRLASVLDQNVQTVRLVCDNYGRCYRSRRYVRAPYSYYDNGYPGYYGYYGPGIFSADIILTEATGLAAMDLEVMNLGAKV